MLGKINPSTTPCWKLLSDHFEKMRGVHMKDLFAADRERFKRFSLRFNDILIDYSKNRITGETLKLLLGLAEEIDLKDAIEKSLPSCVNVK